MERDRHFWFTTLMRGFVALLAGSAIIVIPDMARTLLLLPIAIAMAILGLAVYGMIDSAFIFVSSYMVDSRRARIVLRLQGSVGVTVGVVLFFVVFEQVRLEWFLTLAALQALSLAAAEIIVARHQKSHALSAWNYSAAVIAFCFGGAYLIVRLGFSARLAYRDVSWLVYAYLVALGIAQCLTAGRMIYADYSATGSDREILPSGG